MSSVTFHRNARARDCLPTRRLAGCKEDHNNLNARIQILASGIFLLSLGVFLIYIKVKNSAFLTPETMSYFCVGTISCLVGIYFIFYSTLYTRIKRVSRKEVPLKNPLLGILKEKREKRDLSTPSDACKFLGIPESRIDDHTFIKSRHKLLIDFLKIRQKGLPKTFAEAYEVIIQDSHAAYKTLTNLNPETSSDHNSLSDDLAPDSIG